MWTVIKRARAKSTKSALVRTSKILVHGWLPVMHMNRSTATTQQCPGCEEADETLEHMLQCPNERMEAARSDAIQCVRTKGLAQDFTKPFMTCVTHYLKRNLEGLEGE